MCENTKYLPCYRLHCLTCRQDSMETIPMKSFEMCVQVMRMCLRTMMCPRMSTFFCGAWDYQYYLECPKKIKLSVGCWLILCYVLDPNEKKEDYNTMLYSLSYASVEKFIFSFWMYFKWNLFVSSVKWINLIYFDEVSLFSSTWPMPVRVHMVNVMYAKYFCFLSSQPEQHSSPRKIARLKSEYFDQNISLQLLLNLYELEQICASNDM